MAFIIINDFFNFLYKVLANIFITALDVYIYNILQKKKKK